ncbi:hypothetical protein MNEG_9954 [Monoraphidium neglectum]|uniref:Uncharacterized protein n=1 Tax=Monoraphidium neglectum TaxID=145388 RepID=A0A0D2MAS2_9CHLO|nr:hypothetical protein MNEG_9954 [Monoraphidium neglectum]KIY98011.1 hypothetical protein MNEG_9954 [Monoraphidium neglectum]|eukprot:XP_013897031.1 hypothetical protein MNEG_9954 [Monoraphidium neglectum]
MKYRRREDNYVFWQDKFLRCSLEIPAAEKRWTIFSSVWFLVKEAKFNSVPASLRYIWFIAWRAVMQRVYEAHKAVVLWQSKVDAALAAKAVRDRSSSSGSASGSPISGSEASGGGEAGDSSGSGTALAVVELEQGPGFSRAMALRRLHWRNSLLGEILYAINIAKTGRVHMLPPVKRPLQRPTFFFLF